MCGVGGGELVMILILALLFVGPDKLPKIAAILGRIIRTIRQHTTDLQQTIERDEHIGPSVRELRSALRGDPIYEPPRRSYVQPPGIPVDADPAKILEPVVGESAPGDSDPSSEPEKPGPTNE